MTDRQYDMKKYHI